MVGMYQTVRPEKVETEMSLLMEWYRNVEADIDVLAEFHARYESIHPFQDGNGRTGRLILFRECLRNRILPVVVEDVNRDRYLEALKEYREQKVLVKLAVLFREEQVFYREKCGYFM